MPRLTVRPKSLVALEKRSSISVQVGFCVGHQCTVVRKEDFLEETLQALCFGSETTQVEEGAVQTTANVDTFLQVTDSVGQHAGEEDIEEDRG